MTRTAISPRLAIRIFFSTSANVGGVEPEHVIPEDASNGNAPVSAEVDQGGDRGGAERGDGGGSLTDDAPVDHLGRPDWASIDWPPGWTVRHLVETGSTNTDLLAAHDAGDASHRTVFATDHQTAGRGRLDRRWDAPPGANLLTSLLFSREGPDGFACMAMVSLAAIDAIEQLADASLRSRLGLKWPNDLLLDEQKLAGVLAQRSPTSGAIVVGIGLNVSWAPEGAAFVNRNLELDVRPDEVLQKMLAAIEEMLCHPAVRDRDVAR